MDFGIYPPEINSGRMYTGPGSGPMLAAAQAWGSLADELYTAASAYQSVGLGADLRGVVGSVVDVDDGRGRDLRGMAQRHRCAGRRDRRPRPGGGRRLRGGVRDDGAAAGDRRQPQPAGGAGGDELLGENTPAIAATEAQYAEMWAQDAVAMYGYAGSSAAATVLSPFTSPDQNTDPGGTASQAAAVSQASGSAAGNAQGTISAVPQALSAAAAPAQTDPLTTLANLISVFLSAPSDLATLFAVIPMDALSGPVDLPIAYLGTIGGLRTDNTISGWEGTEAWPGTEDVPPERFQARITNPGAFGASGPSASLGQANTIGALSVPSNWTVAAPEIRSVALTTPLTGVSRHRGGSAIGSRLGQHVQPDGNWRNGRAGDGRPAGCRQHPGKRQAGDPCASDASRHRRGE